MACFIKWVVEDGATAAPAMQFATLEEAMDTACAVLPSLPQDLWIEDEHGWRVADIARIIRHCQRAGRRVIEDDQ